MLLALVVLLAQAQKPELPLMDPDKTVQVSGSVPKQFDREPSRQGALADALCKLVEACGGKVSENVAGGTSTHWRGRFAEGVRVVADQVKKGGAVAEELTRVEIDTKDGTAVLAVGAAGEIRTKLDPKVLEQVFGKDSTTRFRTVREYEAGNDFIVELAYVLPAAAGEMLPFAPGRRWTWKQVRRVPGDESATAEQEIAAIVEKVEKGVAAVRLNRSGKGGAESMVVDVLVGAKGPLVQDVESRDARRSEAFARPGVNPTNARWMMEQMQEGTLPGLFASLPGHLPLRAGDTWKASWEGNTQEGSLSYEEEVHLSESLQVDTPVGKREGLTMTRVAKEVTKISLGNEGTRTLTRARTWDVSYADRVGCVRCEEREVETSATLAPDGTSTAPTTSEVRTVWELTEVTGAK